jgi:hypothetical protein
MSRGYSMRKLFLAALMLATALPVVAVSQPVASAAPLADLTCPISVTLNASPGLTLASQVQQVTGETKGGTSLLGATACSSLTGVPYHGATGRVTGSGTQNCLLQGSLSGTIALTWDNGDTSTIAWSESLVLFIPLLSASVTSGALKGSGVVALLIPTGFNGTCLLGPLRGGSLVGVATFLRF